MPPYQIRGWLLKSGMTDGWEDSTYYPISPEKVLPHLRLNKSSDPSV